MELVELDLKGIIDSAEFKACRSSGPGGQNVNKTNSKVLLILDTDVLPEHLKARVLNRCKVSEEGLLTVTCQETRDQSRNRVLAAGKLERMLLEAFQDPKQRITKMRDELNLALEEWAKQDKQHNSKKKQDRNYSNRRANEY